MKDGKLIYSLHIHVDLFTVRFHPTKPCCKDLRQIAKFYCWFDLFISLLLDTAASE